MKSTNYIWVFWEIENFLSLSSKATFVQSFQEFEFILYNEKRVLTPVCVCAGVSV